MKNIGKYFGAAFVVAVLANVVGSWVWANTRRRGQRRG